MGWPEIFAKTLFKKFELSNILRNNRYDAWFGVFLGYF